MINEADLELAEAQIRAKKLGLVVIMQFVVPPLHVACVEKSMLKVTVYGRNRECGALIPASDTKRKADFINDVCDAMECVLLC